MVPLFWNDDMCYCKSSTAFSLSYEKKISAAQIVKNGSYFFSTVLKICEPQSVGVFPMPVLFLTARGSAFSENVSFFSNNGPDFIDSTSLFRTFCYFEIVQICRKNHRQRYNVKINIRRISWNKKEMCKMIRHILLEFHHRPNSSNKVLIVNI